MVVGFHYLYRGQLGGLVPFQTEPWLASVAKFGYLGVNLFFAISGFVIFLSAQGATPRTFAASRVARLYPAYWFAILATVLVVRLGVLPKLAVPWRDVLINFTMLTHWFGVNFVDGAYWSLAVELHFYIMVWLALRLNALRHAPIFLAGWLSLSLVNLIRPIYPLEFVLEVQWAPYFCIGICAYLVQSQGAKRTLVCLFLAASVLAVLCAYKAGKKVAGLDAADAWVAAGLVALIPLVFWLIARNGFQIRGNPVIFWAGALTYPVYLLHEYIGYVGLSALVMWGVAPSMAVLMVVFAVLFLAYWVHVLVEARYAPVIRRVVAGG